MHLWLSNRKFILVDTQKVGDEKLTKNNENIYVTSVLDKIDFFILDF